jgi:hypothetical protein
MRKPSPALIVACVALFCSLGGVSYGVATGFIDSREIKNNTIRAKDIRNGQVTSADLRNDNVTGADVSESSLGKVPSAASADSAAKATNATNATNAAKAGVAGHATTASNASNADAVGGVRERGIDVRLNAGTTAREVFSYGGLRIVMDCGVLGAGGDVSFYLDTSLANAEAIVSGFYNPGGGPPPPDPNDRAAPADFDPGETVALGAGTDGFAGFYGRYDVNYVAPSGSVVSASFAVSEATNAFGGSADCILYGHAQQSG